MAHRSISQPDVPTDPFWADARLDAPRLIDRIPRPRSWWLAALVGIVAVGGAGWWLLRPAAAPIETSLPMASGMASPGSASTSGATTTPGVPETGSTSTSVPEVVVQVAGRVDEPGLYRLGPGARVDDAIRAAGGFVDGADRDRVNLAAPVGDGERVWIPAKGEDQPPALIAGSGGGGTAAGSGPGADHGASGSSAGSTVSPESPINLNTASAEDLDALPGVGPATAAAILAYRDQAGAFRSVEDLLEVRGIGEAKLEQIQPLVRV